MTFTAFEKIPEHFYIAMAGELLSIFGDELFQEAEVGDVLELDYYTGTNGWAVALYAACEKCEMEWVKDYWNSMPYEERDQFDAELTERIKNEFARQMKSGANPYFTYLTHRFLDEIEATKESLAAALDGRDIMDDEINRILRRSDRNRVAIMDHEEADEAREAGLVVCYGYGKDHVVIDGAAKKDICLGPGVPDIVYQDGDDEIHACPPEGEDDAWYFKANFPHAVFTIKEDGKEICRGIVFEEFRKEEEEE